MDRNNNIIENDNDIDLKDIFFALWRNKVVVICSTLVISLLAGIFSVFILSPVYHSKLNIIISMPEVLTTRFGEYALPITSNQQYIQLITSNDVLNNTIRDMEYNPSEVTIEGLKLRISIGAINNTPSVIQNSYDITVSADNPKEAKLLADTLFTNYIEFIDVMTKERAVLFYHDMYSVQIKTLQNTVKSNKELLKRNEELLKNIPQTINQKDALAAIDTKLDANDFIILEDIINPNYTNLESDIILLKQTINLDENSIINYKAFLGELDNEKEAIAKYYEGVNSFKLESTVINTLDNCVYLSSPPVEPTSKTSPSNTRNVIIGAFLGGIIGIIAALLKEYWITKK
jgi:capsular polysaccharide biosynthesis protein